MLLAVGILVAGYCFLRSRTHFILYGIPQIVLSLLLPIGIITLLHQESKLSIPQNTSQQSSPDILIIGIDALDGDTGSEVLQKHLKNHQGVLFTNAFTPLPLTHPAWNSILTGLYPKHHGVRYFFDSPLASKNPELFLPEILKRKKKYLSLFASDQPETSYFTESQGFSHLAQHRIGWEAHLAVTMLNHFIFPALWLNNPWVEAWGDVSFNYAGLFNFDFPRFVNQSFEKFSALGPGPKMLALHTCALHSPIRLTHEELRELPRYWTLAPADFSFAKWPRPGWPQQITPPDWINPYFSRRATVVRFLQDFLDQLETRGYLRKDIVVLLSDHGERFIKDREIYGGVHGVDIQTREQNNVVFTIIDPLMSHFKVSTEAISLIDLTPTLLSRLGISTELMRFDGVALLNEQAKLREPPERPLWVESMGFFDDHTEKDKFPEFNLKTLEESLRYGITGTVSIDEDYYERILSKKETVDIAKTPDYFSIR
jgi:membrane-anchored protein YejM (alkaline phosphatase superfamily)